MADWNEPDVDSSYTDVLSILKDRDQDVARMFDGTSHTNIVSGTKRWNDSQIRFEEWNGSSWDPLITGTADFDVDTVDGQDANEFASATGSSHNRDAKNSDQLDGQDASAFLDVNGTAVNSDQLGGKSPTAYLRSDVSDTMSGQLTMGSDIDVRGNRLLVDGGNGTAHSLRSNTTGNAGVSIRATSNPSSGQPIFKVESSGGTERLRVEHGGRTSTSNDFAVDGNLFRLPRVTSDPGGAQVGDMWYRSDLD